MSSTGKPQYNPQQLTAIDLRGRNVLVSASAGTGKTSVLTERVVSLIAKDKLEISRLLVLTFTKAAAAEMRQRIAGTLAGIAEDKGISQEDREWVNRQLLQLPRAKISTFHSFCNELVRREFSSVGCDPMFRIGDENEVRVLAETAMNECLEIMLAKEHKDFRQLAFAFSSFKDTRNLRQLISDAYRFIRSLPDPWQWLASKIDEYDCPGGLAATSWGREWLRQWQSQLRDAHNQLVVMQRVAAAEGYGPSRLAALAHDAQALNELLTSADAGLKGFLSTIKAFVAGDGFYPLNRLKRKEVIWPDEFKAPYMNLRTDLRKLIKADVAAFTSRRVDTMERELGRLKPVLASLQQALLCYDDIFNQLKQERNILDFNDLEHLALKALGSPQVQAVYRQQFHHILVDECQDSNGVQEALIALVAGGDNVFRVGDVKQSIYRFRMADPALFLQHCSASSSDPEASSVRVDLWENHRSRPNLLNGINVIFRALMQEDRFETNYGPEAELQSPEACGPDAVSDRCTVQLVDKSTPAREDDGEADDEIEVLSDAEAEAHAAARWLLTEREVGQRPWRDFAVLFRSMPVWGEAFLRIFRSYGIPVFADDEAGFFQSVEILLLLDYLNIIDNFQQDLPLLGALRSPFGGFTVDELARIRLDYPEEFFHQSFVAWLTGESAEAAAKGHKFLQTLRQHQAILQAKPLDECIWQIMLQSGYLHFVSAMPAGQQRHANLRLFIAQVRSLVAIGKAGLAEVLRHLKDVNLVGGDASSARLMGEGEDLVRLMTVHKSKGLEFPVVIIPRAGGTFNQKDSSKELLVHQRFGIGLRFFNTRKRIKFDTLPRHVISRQISAEQRAEQMRLLYVALTRAKEKLLVVGCDDVAGKMGGTWRQSMAVTPGMNNWLDWIMTVLCQDVAGEMPDFAMTAEPAKALMQRRGWCVQLAGAQKPAPIVLEEPGPAEATGEKPDLQLPEALNWEYPFATALPLPSKLAVTALQGWLQGKNSPDGLARSVIEGYLAGENNSQALLRGNAIHSFMQYIALDGNFSKKDVVAKIVALVASGHITSEEAKLLAPEILSGFFNSPLGQQLQQAERIYREAPFVLRLDALPHGMAGIDPGEILIQGKLDLYFILADGSAVVVDYKTGQIHPGETREAFASRYAFQVETYCRAVETIRQIKVSSAWIYHFGEFGAVPVPYPALA